jgi:hypothetical protein
MSGLVELTGTYASTRDLPSSIRAGVSLQKYAEETSICQEQMECPYGSVREARTNVRCNFMRILSGFERLLLLGGLLLVAAYAAARFSSVVYSHATLRDFWLNQAATAHQRLRPIHPNSRIADFLLVLTI